MILKIWKKWLCYGFMPMYFGGDSKSDSSTSTTNNTTNNALSVDRRSVASDAAVSLTGDNNIVDRSTSSTTNFSDSSNRSTSSITEFLDNSNRSVTVTDYGSVGSSLSTLGTMTTKALDITGDSVNGAIDALKYISDNNQKSVAGAFDLAKSASANALTNSAQVLGLANDVIDKTSAAFAEAKDNGTSKLVTYALVTVGAIGVAFALK